jgi:hypothetical protein
MYMFVGLLCLVLATSVLSLPAMMHNGRSLPSTDHAVRDLSHTSTAAPSAKLEPQASEHAENREVSDDENMETAEVIVFRPLFRYRQIQAERRRRLEERRRNASNPNYANYPHRI